MLIRFFKQSYIIHFIAFFILAVAYWTPAFIAPDAVYEIERLSPFYNLIITNISNPTLLVVIAFISLFVQSIYLDSILTEHELCDRNSSFVTFFFFTIMSMHISLLKFHPILLAGFFLLKAIDSLLKLYLADDQRRACFKIGFYIGVASLCYFPSIYFILLVSIILMIYRLVTWRKVVIPMIGLIIPYIFLATFYFCIDQLEASFNDYLIISTPDLVKITSFNIYENALGIIGGLFLLIVLLGMFTRISEKSMSVRKKSIVFICILIISIFIFLFRGNTNLGFIILALPMTALTSIYFDHKKKFFWMDLLFTLSVILIIFNNFYSISNA